MRYLVTGGAGFIGSNFIRSMLARHGGAISIVNLDKLTYAGNLANLEDVAGLPNYRFVRGDIADAATVEEVFMGGVDVVVNFAAETHVDRSLLEAGSFIETDVHGVLVLLEAARRHPVSRFIQVSTDEVYGSIAEGAFSEGDVLNPRNPYAASKAGGDRMAYAYWATYGVPVVITRASNNFGPYQYPEKLIPLFVTNAIDDKPLPLYGDGKNVRDWLHVEDHCRAIELLAAKGEAGEVYNIAGGNELENWQIVHRLLELLSKPQSLIQRVPDRTGHDRRYALDGSKLGTLGFTPRHDFDALLADTVDWYVRHPQWWRAIKDRDQGYRSYYEQQYGERIRS